MQAAQEVLPAATALTIHLWMETFGYQPSEPARCLATVDRDPAHKIPPLSQSQSDEVDKAIRSRIDELAEKISPYYTTDQHRNGLIVPARALLPNLNVNKDMTPYLVFVHAGESKMSVVSGIADLSLTEDGTEILPLADQLPCAKINPRCAHSFGKGLYSKVPRIMADVRDWIWARPDVKGTLWNANTNEFLKFHLASPRLPDDVFKLRFPRSKIKKGKRFHADLWDELYAECEAWNGTGKLFHGRREAILQKLAPDYVIYKQETTHIDDLPRDVDPATLERVSLHTIRRTFRELQWGYNKEVRASNPRKTR